MRRKFILSTVGTSLLNNQIKTDANLKSIILATANLKEFEYSESDLDILKKIKDELFENIVKSSIDSIRKASAELNGLLGFYDEGIEKGKNDVHFLLTTDTYQGKISAEIVQKYLFESNISNVNILSIPDLTTKSKDDFSKGIKEILKWCDENINNYKIAGYDIIFNLTGGFKSLQGYLNTISMFYADKVIYIFESGRQLIEIPKLPIRVETELFEQNVSIFAQLAADCFQKRNSILQIPETMLQDVDDEFVGLSDWGLLAWNTAKKEILSSKLIILPFLEYSDDFKKDFNKYTDSNYRIKLNETLAKISAKLQEKFDTSNLKKDHGLQYEKCKNKVFQNSPVDHFRIDEGNRASCCIVNNKMILIHHGFHDVCD